MVKLVSADFFKQSLTIQWTLKDFFALTEKTRSELFCAPFCPQFSWHLVVHSFGLKPGFDGIGIFLVPISDTVNAVKVSLSLWTLDADHCVTNKTFIEDFSTLPKNFSHGFPKCWTRNEIQDKLVDGAFSINARLTYLDIGEECAEVPAAFRLSNMYDMVDDATADFEIEVSGKKVSVHRAILKLVWPYFKTMVETSMDEAGENRWLIEDFNFYTVKAVVIYMYTGMIAFHSVATATEVKRAAYQYGIEELVQKALNYNAQQSFVNCLSVDNALETLLLVELYDFAIIKTHCFKKIMAAIRANKGKYQKLEDFPGHEAFANSPMANKVKSEFLDFFINNCNCEVIGFR